MPLGENKKERKGDSECSKLTIFDYWHRDAPQGRPIEKKSC